MEHLQKFLPLIRTNNLLSSKISIGVRCSISKCLSVFGWRHLTPATTRFLVQNVSFRAIFRDFLGSNSSLSFVTEAGLKFSRVRQWHEHSHMSAVPRDILKFCHMRPLPLRGTRIGEAQNPGPDLEDSMTVNFAITNPTSIVSKFPHYLKLTEKYNIHVHGVAETSATLIAQKAFQSKMTQINMQALWSKPVAAHTERLDHKESYRGKASGVALFSKFPMRMMTQTVPEDLLLTSRILHGLIYFGSFQIQVVQIYCLPKTVEGSSDFNNRLLTAAYQAIQLCPIPTIMMGDFNAEPEMFNIHLQLQELGFFNLIEHHRQMYGIDMPATCREVTRTDYAFLSHHLRPFLRGISVKVEKCFDTHEPVMFTLGLPTTPLYRQKLVLPKTWISLDLPEEEFEQHYNQQIESHGTPTTIEEWGVRVEQMLQSSYQAKQLQHGVREPKQLPKKHTMAGMKQARQLRRIRSLLGLIKKYPIPTEQVADQMQQEWQAICKSRAFGVLFTEWAQNQPDIGPLPRATPNLNKISDIVQIVKFHVDAKINHDHLIWTRKVKYARQMDVKEQGAKQAYKVIKGPPKPMLTTLQHTLERQVILAPTDQPAIFEAYGDSHAGFRHH